MIHFTNYIDIPKDVALLIFSELDDQDLWRCRQVNKEWRTLLLNNNPIWKRFFPDIELPTNTSLGQYMQNKVIRTPNEMIRILSLFIKTLKRNESRQLKCHFPARTNRYVNIALTLQPSTPVLTQDFFYIGKLDPTWFSQKSSITITSTDHELIYNTSVSVPDQFINKLKDIEGTLIHLGRNPPQTIALPSKTPFLITMLVVIAIAALFLHKKSL